MQLTLETEPGTHFILGHQVLCFVPDSWPWRAADSVQKIDGLSSGCSALRPRGFPICACVAKSHDRKKQDERSGASRVEPGSVMGPHSRVPQNNGEPGAREHFAPDSMDMLTDKRDERHRGP